jgi:RHS repeat-associated protein
MRVHSWKLMPILAACFLFFTAIETQAAAPTITSLSPTSGAVGATVTITGTNFGSPQGSSTVKFNGTSATATSWSPTSIVATVPTGATTGNVVVTVSGTASNGKSFTVVAAPSITSLSVTTGAVGAAVTITGTNFGSTQGSGTVKFNGTTATVTSWSATSLVTTVPSGATTGNVVVFASGVNSNGSSFTVVSAPSITSLSPTTGAVGASVTITGTNFGSSQGTSTVKFNGTTATVTSWSATSLVTTVPTGATTGNVVVFASGVNSNGSSFTVVSAPSITSLSVTSGAVGTSVTITGTNFGSSQGTSTVKFNGTTATVTTWSATTIATSVPSGATTGNVVVFASGVNSNGVNFTVVPKITSLSPTSGAVGASVTITGTTFGSTQGSSTVKFNGTAGTPTSWSATSIVMPVPSGATTGNVVVTVSSQASNGVSFTVVPAPSITSLSPATGAVGASVTITGTNFGATQGSGSVSFNGTTATVTSWSATSLVTTVPSGATTGNVVVFASGVNSNGSSFTVVSAPSITSLSPTTGAVGAAVTITGTNFGSSQGTSTVKFNGTTATVTSWSATSLVTTVPTGATTGNVVVFASGVNSNGSSFTVVSAPSITSLSVTSGAVGTSVTITGTNFGATQGSGSVSFNGTAATVTSWSATTLVTTVPTGATTGNVVVFASGVNSNGSSFTVVLVPNIASLSPTTGAVGASVTITGTNFGATQGSGSVSFNGTAATVTSWSATSIVVSVPSGATTGNVVVTASSQASNGVNFTVVPAPSVTSLSPNSGAAGVSVTIAGTNFGVTQGNGSVSFNGTSVTPLSWSATSVVAAVPSSATTGNVVVNASGVASNGVNFTVLPTPSITSLSPTSGPVGTSVTITGTNFGSSQGSSTVTFDGAPATVTSWSATSIATTVPSGATTGNIVVFASGVNSNGSSFTVTESLSISGLSPTSGAVGSGVSISGTGFGATQGSSTVSLNGASATVTNWSDTDINTIVPSGASSGPFSVTVNGNAVNSASFTVTALPSGWADTDIGSVGSAGSASYSNGAFSLVGGGVGTTGATTSDGLHFAYQQLSGDGSIIARVVSAQGGSYPEAVAMIRETLNPGASEVSVGFYSNYIYVFQRDSTGASTSNANYVYLPSGLPYWVELVRSGNTFTEYASLEGETWTQLGTSQTITMAQNVYIGLATAYGNTSGLSTGVFDGVSVNSAAAPAPVITSLSATTASIGSQIAITGTGFGASQNGGLVLLNGAPLPVYFWSSTSIVVTIPTGSSTGSLLVSVAPEMNDSNAVWLEITSQPLPTSWLDTDIGAVGSVGSASYANGVFTVVGGGMGSYTTSDGLHFMYQPLSGDGTIIARLVNVQSNNYPESLAMIRETLNPGASEVSVGLYSNYIYVFQRDSTGATTSNSNYVYLPSGLPYWVEVVRSGNTFSEYASLDGVNWTQLGSSQTITMAQNVYIGLTTSYGSSTSGSTTATFDSVSLSTPSSPAPLITGLSATTGSVGSQVVISGSGFGASQGSSVVTLNNALMTINSWSSTSIVITIPTGATTGYLEVSVAPNMNDSNAVYFTVTTQPLPTPWLDQDIGLVGMTGSATYASGTFTVVGGGAGVTSTSDALHFVYQPLSGNGSIVAQIVTAQGTDYPEALVMIRETLNAGATEVSVGYYSGYINVFQRDSTGATTSHSNYVYLPTGPPYWVELVRTGNTFSEFASPDGVNWTQLGTSQTISMAQNVYIGLASDYGATSGLTTSTFNNVSVVFGTTPIVTSVSPTLGGMGVTATITGSNFGTSQGTSTVAFNGTQATSITSWGTGQVVATVPSSATSGIVTVTVGGIQSPSSTTFTVINPVISSLNPPAAQPSSTITLSGSGFGANQSSSQVQLNGVSATVLSWSNSSITVAVASNATSGPVTVLEDGVTSNGVQFTVLEPLTVTGLSTSSGPVGSTLTITGTGFGPTQSNSSVVFFPGVAATVNSWSDTQLVAFVPAGAASGPVGVGVATEYAFGPTFNLTSIGQLTDSLGNQTTYTSELIGGRWVPLSVQGSGCSSCTLRGTISNNYDTNGNAISRTDELGRTTTYTYDAYGDVLSVSVPLGSGTYAVTSYTYNGFGEVLTSTDPLGKVTTNTYDGNGNLLTVTTPAPTSGVSASVTQFAYNSLGELTTITDPLNNGTTLTYTSAGLISTITDMQSNVTTYGYDSHGNRTSVTDALNHKTTFAYDSMDRLITITYPDTTTTTFAYDYRGRRTSVTDQNGKTTSYAYDDADRLLTVTDAATNVTTYGYDTENNLTSIKDANNNTTSFAYDAFGRVIQTTFPSMLTESYYYDAVGNLTSKTDRKGQVINYTYDQLNRLTLKTYPDTTTVNYTYDNDSRLTQVTDPTGTYSFTFDNMGRLTNTTTQYAFLTARNFTTSYGYDAASNRTGFTDPEGGGSTYAYDTLNRLQTLTPPSTISSGNFGFGYDALSRRTSLTRPNSVNTTYGYDNLSRLLSVTHAMSGTTLDGATYAVDNAGNRTSRTPQPSGTASNYTYDPIYELTQVTQGASTTESYTFDPVGNRLSNLAGSGWSYNSSNELGSRTGFTYTYDNNGNTATEVNSSGTTTFAWDFENRLTSVTLPGSGGTVTFKYDPFGRRIYKSSSAGTSIYAYDRQTLIEETNASGGVVARYSQGLNIDEPLAMLRSGTTSYYDADGLSSATSLSSSAGALAQTYTFDSFGKLTNSSGSLTNPFQYTGREFDAETSLYYYRARYYDTVIGRFLSEDPARMDGGSNLYTYVRNNPIILNDPFGLFHVKPGVPYPNLRLEALLDCIEWQTGLTLNVTSTNEPPPHSPHGPNDPHIRDGGLAVDISYPFDPEWVLNGAACCGAKYGRNENFNPSAHSNAAHLHLQIVPGPACNDLPKNPICKGSKK